MAGGADGGAQVAHDLAVGAPERAPTFEHRAGHPGSGKVGPQATERVGRAGQLGQPLVERFSFGEAMFEVQEQRVEGLCSAGAAQVFEQGGGVDRFRLGIEDARFQATERARDAGAESVVAFDGLDAREPVRVDAFPARQDARGGPAGQRLEEGLRIDREQE